MITRLNKRTLAYLAFALGGFAVLSVTLIVSSVSAPGVDWTKVVRSGPAVAARFYGGYDWACRRFGTDQLVCQGLSTDGNQQRFLLYSGGQLSAEGE